jgi:transposase
MKTTELLPFPTQLQKYLPICLDVAKDSLTWYVKHQGKSQTGTLEYRGSALEQWFAERKAAALAQGYTGLQIVCESTGTYHRRLLRMAREQGCTTAMVSGEQVNALQIVESNDTGKSDWKDPRTMMLLVEWGKTLKDRDLGEQWSALREWDAWYNRIEARMIEVKNRLHNHLNQLYPELSFKKDWRFESEAARQLVKHYGFDPLAILAAGENAFTKTLEKEGVRPKTIARLWCDAIASKSGQGKNAWRNVIVAQVRASYAELALHNKEREEVREAMVAVLTALQEAGEVKLKAQPGLIGAFLLSRIVAQTGPLKEFKAIEQLWRYAGMNLRSKQSGNVRQKERQAKRGRSQLRKVLGQTVLKLVVKGALYGDYYHAKKAAGMAGPVAMTAVARKLLKLLFGLERSQSAYDPKRVFASQSQYQQKKAA